MSLKKIIRKNIEDSAVTEPKLANEAVTAEKLSTDVITGLGELSEQAASDDLLVVYDTSAGALKKVSKSNTTALEFPTVSSVSPTSVVSDAGTTTFTITGTGFTEGTNARLIGTNGRVRNFATVTRDSTTQLTATINVTTDMAEVDTPYGVQVISGTGLNDLLASQIDIDQYPVFVTASGSLGTFAGNATGVNIVIDANDPDSAGNITYELQSGSLPSGLSLSNSSANGGIAIISGDVDNPANDTTSNFVIRAVDAASNTSSRSFSITVNNFTQYSSFIASGTFAVPSGTTTLKEVLVVGGGGPGRTARPSNNPWQGSGGGGAGGLVFYPNYPVTPGGTLSVTVGCASQDSVFGSPGDPGLSGDVLTAKAGGAGAGSGSSSCSGGSGGGGSRSNTSGASATQPTQPGSSGAYGFGNAGGNGTSSPRFSGGGGGGANASGSTAPGSAGGNGGGGKAYTIADGTTPVYYAGGGGGGLSGCPGNAPWPPSYPGGTGGQGGGGNGGPLGGGRNIPGQPGQANKGGGGGGGSSAEGNPNTPGGGGGAGGKGIVIVKY